VPAHVTLLYPFMPVEGLDDKVRAALGRIVASEPTFTVRFNGIARFPNVVYLPPEPADPFQRLTAAIAAQFPDYPPYQGAYETVVPHMTVAQDVPTDFYAAAEHALPAALPVTQIVREAWLIGHMPEQPWHTLWRLPLGDAPRT
jgi:2'-5' RNA ligase